MTGARDKVTLVQASGWLSDFHQFKLNVTQFPTIFRWSELRETEPSSKATSEAPKPQPVKIEKRPTPETLSRVRDLDSWRDKPVNSLSSWRNRTVSPSGSALLIDISNERDDDVRTDVGTETSQNTEQICKYFKKVNKDLELKNTHCSHGRVFAIVETNALLSTIPPHGTGNHQALLQSRWTDLVSLHICQRLHHLDL